MTKAQVKTKKRVSDHGEVFTHEREVNAVLTIFTRTKPRFEIIGWTTWHAVLK